MRTWLAAMAKLILFTIVLVLNAMMWQVWVPFEFGRWPTQAEANRHLDQQLRNGDTKLRLLPISSDRP